VDGERERESHPAEARTTNPAEPSTERELKRRLVLPVGIGAWLVFMLAVGLPRALERHIHIDEVQLAYESALVRVHHAPELAMGTGSVLALAGFVLPLCDSTLTMFASLRLIFFAMFGVRLALMAWRQPYFTSAPGRVLVLGLVSLVHLQWQNGFEIRMDGLVAIGSIALYGLAQQAVDAPPANNPRPYVWAGLWAASMQAQAGKALLFWAPFSLLFLAVATRNLSPKARIRPAMTFVVAVAVGTALNLGVVFASGEGDLFLRGMLGLRRYAGGATRFSPNLQMWRVLVDSPWLFGLAFLQPVLLVLSYVKRTEPDRTARQRSAVTTAFLAWSFFALYLNPAPYAYNFVHILPFVTFAGLDTAAWVMRRSGRFARLAAVAMAAPVVLMFVHAWQTDPFMLRTNSAQLSYARAAEALTSGNDTVLDAAGLVLTRKPPDKDWYLHSLRMAGYRDGRFRRFASILRETPSPVLIDNYRWEWLSREDLLTRSARYVKLAPRLFVLGQNLNEPEGELGIHLRGTYRAVSKPPQAIMIDGVEHEDGSTFTLDVGEHPFVRTNEGVTIVHWIGPKPEAALDAVAHIESLGRGEPMYVNEPSLPTRR
jgi:hypothetical protein